MATFKNDKGLTLIELLITISVLAVVSAIALPVINNVVTASNSNAYNQTVKDAQAFIDKYSKSGVVVYDGLKTLAGYIDKDGDNKIEADEKVDTLTLDDKYSISVTGSASEGGSYTNGGVTEATITVASAGGSSNTPSNAPVLQQAAYTYDYWAATNINNTSGSQQTWSTAYPVLVIYESTGNGVYNQYAFITVQDAAYGIDYYDSSYYQENNLSYVISSAGQIEYIKQTLTHYDADPFAGPANKVAINWTGAAGGSSK